MVTPGHHIKFSRPHFEYCIICMTLRSLGYTLRMNISTQCIQRYIVSCTESTSVDRRAKEKKNLGITLMSHRFSRNYQGSFHRVFMYLFKVRMNFFVPNVVVVSFVVAAVVFVICVCFYRTLQPW